MHPTRVNGARACPAICRPRAGMRTGAFEIADAVLQVMVGANALADLLFDGPFEAGEALRDITHACPY